MTKRRVVVTGVGVITPLGLNVDTMWKALLNGKSGVTPITCFDASDSPVKIAAHVENFDPTGVLEPKEIRKNDVFIQFGVVAAAQAIHDSGLNIENEDADRIGTIMGSGIGGLPVLQASQASLMQKGISRVSPSFIPSSIINMLPGLASIKFGLKGPSFSIVSACATGAHSIATAARLIQVGDADVMVTGGAEMATTPLGVGGFAAARALSRRNDEPEKASRPWDKDRDGFIMGDGAGMLVLEEYEHAKARGAHIYAELAGIGMSADAYHITAPDAAADGSSRAIKHALASAKLNTNELDYINAHGTSTLAGDIVEVRAIKNVFGEQAYKLPVSSTKSMTGHMLGAAGAVEAVVSVLAIQDKVAPPTINLDNPDDECDLDFVPHVAREMKIDTVLSNSLGFGGTNVALLFKRIK
ncbi:MAG: beta-ketoacyl-ACP synthase II [Gammaproteobacteria bacterium]|nr:beta-ketoacyl-ACP synthase II [Gammaproteobacteria bacterium]